MLAGPALRRYLRYAAWAAGLAVAALATVAIVVALRFQPEDLARLVSARVQERTGRELAIEGPVSYSLSLLPTLSAERVRLQNAPWGSRPDMVSAREIQVRIALLPLLAGKVEVRALELIAPDVLIEIDRNGKGNWRFDSPGDAAEQAPGETRPPPTTIRSVRIEQGTLAYRNAVTGRELGVAIGELEASNGGRALRVAGNASFNEVPVEIEATLPAPGAGDAPSTKSDVTLTGAGFRFNAKGTAAWRPDMPAADFAFSTQVSDWAAAGKLLQHEFGKLPALDATATVRVAPDATVLENLDARIGKSRLTGHVRWMGSGEARTLDVRLDSPLVDLAELLGPDNEAPRPDGRIFSAEPLPIALLAGLTGDAAVRIGRLALRDGKTIGEVVIDARFDRGRIAVDPAQLDVEGKLLRARLQADARSGKRLQLQLVIDGQGIPLGALGALLNVTGTPEGSATDISVRLAARGDSMRTLLATASGEARIVVGPGRIRNRVLQFGADITELLKLLNPAYAADPYTELECAVVRLPLRQGVARIDNSIGIETSKVDVIAAGSIDFRNETLDLGFRTRPATGLGVGLGTLAELGRLRGTLSDPDVEVDLGNAAETAAHVGLAAITGGVSLIASGLLAKRVPDRPCQVALNGGTGSREASGGQAEPGVVDNVLGNIKKLFGR